MLPRDADIVQSSPENCRRVGGSHRPKAHGLFGPRQAGLGAQKRIILAEYL